MLLKLHFGDYAPSFAPRSTTVCGPSWQRSVSIIDQMIAMSSTLNTPPSSNNSGSLGSTSSAIKQLSAKLAQWRGLLPHQLQWSDSSPISFQIPQSANPDSFNQSLDPSLSPTVNNSGFAIFTADLDSEPTFYPYIYDVQVALLRTRYYYTKYVIHQPFVYKALHFPEQLTEDDARGVAECLQVWKSGVPYFRVDTEFESSRA